MAARSHHPVGRLLETDPARAAEKVSAKLEASGGAITPTALALGVDQATLYRWIQRLRDEGFEVGPIRSRGKPRGKPRDPEALRAQRNARRRAARAAHKKGLAKARMMR